MENIMSHIHEKFNSMQNHSCVNSPTESNVTTNIKMFLQTIQTQIGHSHNLVYYDHVFMTKIKKEVL